MGCCASILPKKPPKENESPKRLE